MNPNRVRFLITAVAVVVSVVVLYALIRPLLSSSPSSSSSSPSSSSSSVSSNKPNPRPDVYVVNDSRFSAGLPSGWAVTKEDASTKDVTVKEWEFQGQPATTMSITVSETPLLNGRLTQPSDTSTSRATSIPIDGETGIILVSKVIGSLSGQSGDLISVSHNGELFSVGITPLGDSTTVDPGALVNDLIATWNWK